MTSLQLVDADIPPLDDKVAVVTGGSSGIGLGAVQVLCEHHAHVIILDISPPPQAISSSDFVTYLETDISSWPSLVRSFAKISKQHGGIDIAIGNAGIAENNTYLAKCLMPATGSEEEWNILENEGDAIAKMHEVVDVNFKGTSNFVLLASRMMKASGGGSIVLTTSATAYMPEHSIPLYCATKAGLTGLVRSLRSTLIHYNISISAVAPAATTSAMLPHELEGPIQAASLPISTARHVGLALVYSAVARQSSRVENYAGESPLKNGKEEKWNGRVIVTLGDAWTEVEEQLVQLRPKWWGEKNENLTVSQQKITDFRFIGS